MSVPVHRWIGLGLTAAAFAALLLGAGWLELRSVERANRDFRAERYSDAAARYRLRLSATAEAKRVRYNLGTSLLFLGDPDRAKVELERALDARDTLVAFRSRYNLGFLVLVGAVTHPRRDSAEVLARTAVELNRQALRLAPDADSARWNLALAQRALDSLLWLRAGVGEEEVRDSLEDRDLDRVTPALLRELESQSGSFGGHFFSRGEREALARDLANSPLTEEEANDFLMGMDQSPDQVLRRIFLVRSPNRWRSTAGVNRRPW